MSESALLHVSLSGEYLAHYHLFVKLLFVIVHPVIELLVFF